MSPNLIEENKKELMRIDVNIEKMPFVFFGSKEKITTLFKNDSVRRLRNLVSNFPNSFKKLAALVASG